MMSTMFCLQYGRTEQRKKPVYIQRKRQTVIEHGSIHRMVGLARITSAVEAQRKSLKLSALT